MVCVVGRSDGTAVVSGVVVRGASVEVGRAPSSKGSVGCVDRAAVAGGVVCHGESAEVGAAVVVGGIREVGAVDGHAGMIGRAV